MLALEEMKDYRNYVDYSNTSSPQNAFFYFASKQQKSYNSYSASKFEEANAKTFNMFIK